MDYSIKHTFDIGPFAIDISGQPTEKKNGKDYGPQKETGVIYIHRSAQAGILDGDFSPPVGARNVDKVVDRAWDAYNKREVARQEDLLWTTLALLLRANGTEPSWETLHGIMQGIKWSRFAGCTCPCSPGWKMNEESTVYVTKLIKVFERPDAAAWRRNMWIDLRLATEDTPQEVERKNKIKWAQQKFEKTVLEMIDEMVVAQDTILIDEVTLAEDLRTYNIEASRFDLKALTPITARWLTARKTDRRVEDVEAGS